MSLLARLAPHLGGYQETTGTEALGLLLASQDAAQAVVRALQTAFPALPGDLRFLTQSGADDTRPDVVGLSNDREVVHIEGKFWAGLTEAQAKNRYLQRLAEHQLKFAPEHPCAGVLVWVCPPRRTAHLWGDVLTRTRATDLTQAGATTWRFAETPSGQGVALIDWISLCEVLEHSGTPELAEDARQLKGFVREVDDNAFLPWTEEQVTDQEWARRHIELIKLTHSVREVGVQRGALDRPKRHSYSALTYSSGPVIYPGGLWTAFLVSPELQAEYGRGPWYLRWWRGAPVAREALRNHNLIELSDGCAVPVPLRAGALRDEVLEETIQWLSGVAKSLRDTVEVRAARGAPIEPLASDGPEASDPETSAGTEGQS